MPDFLAAARRHLADGDLLHASSRLPNAVQLWAYGAECILKAIAFQQNHFALATSGRPLKGFDIHIDKTNNAGQQTLLSLYNATQTGPNALIGPAAAFLGWNISARYEDGFQLQPIAVYMADIAKFRGLLHSALAQGLFL